MRLKHLLITVLTVILTTVPLAGAPKLPLFSDDSNEYWYYIVFTAGQTVLGDLGAKDPVVTRIADASKDNQLWKFVGNAENFKVINKTGNSISAPNYLRSTANPDEAALFRLVPSEIPGLTDSWEIEYPAKGDEYNRWNQWGKTGPGANIGLYTPGEANNALTFLAQADLPKVPVLTKIKEFAVSPSQTYTPTHRHTLWYTNPATAETNGDIWMEYALPVGNGEFGAMIFGGVAQDRVQFNDKSLWTGDSKSRGSYQNFGDLYIEDISGDFSQEKALTDYVRGLDMDEATAFVRYTSPDGSVEYTRDYIASNPDKVVAIHLGASQPGKISVRLRLFNGVNLGMLAPKYENGEIEFNGLLSYINFKARVKPVAKGGTITTNEDNIEIKGADEVTIILAGATNFDQHSPTYLSDKNMLPATIDSRVDAATAKTWESILADHQTDFAKYFSRVEFEIDPAANNRTTKSMVQTYNRTRPKPVRTDPSNLMLEELYYAYGRYLLISCSRGMDTPANLQGIWNHTNSPAWQCDIHSNINVQMNYWPAEPTNLSEMHMPYLNYIHSMALEHNEWQEYARRSGQTEGWTCFTQNNIFGHSDYAENYVIANAWYTSHLWQHYIYTLDREFLKNKALPVMLSCTRFWMQRLVKDSDGTWVAPKEWSPEHGPAEEDATAHAQQIVNELFKTTLRAIEILGDDAGVDNTFISELKEKFNNLDKGLAIETYTGSWGASVNGINTGDPILREWKKSNYSVGENEHRHQSHLMSMYPYGEITPESEWFVPAVNSLKLRGDVSTGWSLAWRIALWARALDSEHAHKIIVSALRHATSYDTSRTSGGIYYNLFDSHAPFQIDGNFGYTAGVTELLLQSYNGKIRLLPTLPGYWSDGHIYGIKAEGNFEIDQKWKENKLTEAVVRSGSGLDCTLNYPGISEATVISDNNTPVTIIKIDSDNVKFQTAKGVAYTILPQGNSRVAEISEPEMKLKVTGDTASVNLPGATIKAYDIAGRLLISSSDSSLDLSGLERGALIIKASLDGNEAVLKIIR